MPKPAPGRPVINKDRSVQRMYWVWHQMIARCHKPSNKWFYNYGERGIQVCSEWRESFWSFYDDMAPKPFSGAILDRIDNDAGYSKANCRWVSMQKSNENRRYCVLMDGVPLKTWMRNTGQEHRYRMVMKRVARGMPLNKAIETPARGLQ